MKGWNWLRIACAVGAAAAGALATVVPATAPIAAKVAFFLGGVAVRTPGHVPADDSSAHT